MNTGELEELVGKLIAGGVTVVVLTLGPVGRPAEPAPQAAPPPGTGSTQLEAPAGRDRPPLSLDGGTRAGEQDTSGSGTTDSDAGEMTRPAPSGDDTTGDSTVSGVTAAETYGWGEPVRTDDFTDGTSGWSIYDGPGHAGNGRRTPDAVSVSDGVLKITGDAEGNTAGMAWTEGSRQYGRWEGRVRAPASDPSYNALLLLWPTAENFPEGGEVDFMEMMDPSRQRTNMFLHYGADNSQIDGEVEIDGTRWHNWAVEWTPERIAAFVDGEQWFETTDTSILPPGPMHLCIQLDWFPKGGSVQESQMQVDWVRQYAVDGGPGPG